MIEEIDDMNIDEWKYYNHAAIPTKAPHEIPNMPLIDNGNMVNALIRMEEINREQK